MTSSNLDSQQAAAPRRFGPSVSLHESGDVARICLDDGKGNTLGSAVLAALGEAIAEASRAGAVLLVGREQIFSGGLDLFEIAALPRAPLIEFLDLLHATRRALFMVPRPVLVAVAGSAIGAGASLLCCGDTRLGARDGGRVGLPEVRLGVPLPSSTQEILQSVLPPVVAAKVLLFGETYGREEALAMGFFDRLVEAPRLLDEAEHAARSAARASTALGQIKRSLRREALRRMDADRRDSHEAFAAAWTGPEAQALIGAVLDRLRAPRGPK
jgi:enoyl-CoA hydratase